MSIRLSLLAILAEGACYGYQLRAEFERRTGGSRSLNVGQVYATLDRLERDGMVAKSQHPRSSAHVDYAITADGHRAVTAWWASASPADEVAAKLALALTLPGADAAAVIGAQRSATERARAALAADPEDADLSRRVVVSALIASADAELRWLGECVELLGGAEPYPLDPEPPRRGRPAAAGAAAESTRGMTPL